MDEHQRGQDFLRLYNEVDHFVKKLTDAPGSMPFWKRLRIAAKTHPALRRHLDDLLEFHELRNAIVHHRDFPAALLAVPSEDVVRELARIVAKLNEPEGVLPRFARNVHVFSANSPLADALSYMNKHGYGQLAVRDGGRLRLVTSLGIARWLLALAGGTDGGDGVVDLRAATLSAILPHEPPETMALLPRDATHDDAEGVFERAAVKSPRRLFAIVITEHGDAAEEPLGLITPGELLSGRE